MLGGRGDDAHVDLDPLGAAYALELLVDEHAQDLALGFARHVAHLVEVEDATMRLLQRADLAVAAVRFRAEKLDLHPLGRDGGSVERDERPAGAR